MACRAKGSDVCYDWRMGLLRPIVLLGLPGVGKSSLALAVASRWRSIGEPWFVLHTDLLKVTLRNCYPGRCLEPGYRLTAESQQIYSSCIAQHILKAKRDGYGLLVEGTAAITANSGLKVVLETDELTRRQRIEKKHGTAIEGLLNEDLSAYRDDLLGLSNRLVLDNSGTLSSAMEALEKATGR